MKGNCLARFLRKRDSFGHAVQLIYKGNETYNSLFGGIVTLMVQALTLIMVIQAVTELASMEDPLIINYPKPLTIE